MSFKYFLLLSTALTIYGCANRHPFADASNQVQTDFKNEGEREDYEVEHFFIKNYKVEHYKKHKGPIVLKDDHYEYKDAIIDVPSSAEMKAILDKGIFYPDVMRQAYKYLPKIRFDKDSLVAWRKRGTSTVKPIFNKFPRIDSLRIYNFDEIKSSENTPKQKRFRFWLVRKSPFFNPTVCFMELTNKNATSETDLLSFINGSKLTFFQEGWIII